MELTDEEVKIEEEFEDIIRNKLTQEQFDKWVMTWFDNETIIDMALEWETDVKKEDLEYLRKLIKNNKN